MTAAAGPWAVPVRGLLVDIDDTLVDTQAAMRSSCTRGAQVAWPDQDGGLHEALSGWFYDDPGARFDAYTRGELDFEQMRRARYAEACARVGLPAQRFDAFEEEYLVAFSAAQALFADALPLLERAEAARVPVCLLTNSGDEQTDLKLQRVGLVGRAPVITTDTLGVGKPDPRPFAAAAAAIGRSADEVVVVGDTLPTDVTGALAAGMRVAWLQRPGLPAPRDAGWGTDLGHDHVRVVPSLHAVADLLHQPGG